MTTTALWNASPAALSPRREAEVRAYYAGRNSWFPGEPVPTVNPYAADKGLAREFARGLRAVRAEENLNLDTSWDE